MTAVLVPLEAQAQVQAIRGAGVSQVTTALDCGARMFFALVGGGRRPQRPAPAVRYELSGRDATGGPFRTLSEWHEDESLVTLLLGDNDPVDACRLRECSLDLQKQRLLVSIYTPFSAQDVSGWFPLED